MPTKEEFDTITKLRPTKEEFDAITKLYLELGRFLVMNTLPMSQVEFREHTRTVSTLMRKRSRKAR